VKSLLGYAHRLGYAPFNAGATIKVRSDAGNRGATLAKRIISEVEVGLLIRGARTKRDRVLLEVIYAGGLRVSEAVVLVWADILPRGERVQLSITGKGGKVRQVLLPEIVSRSVLSLRGDASANDPVFASRKGGGRLTERGVHAMVKRAAAAAGITGRFLRIGCATPTAPTQSITVPACWRFKRRSAMATSPRLAATCTLGLTPRAGSSSTLEYSFDEDA
jgi:integrase/recombinase XerD